VSAPPELVNALRPLWGLRTIDPNVLHKRRDFIQLCEVCESHYTAAEHRDGIRFGLSTALQSLGIPCLTDERSAANDYALAAEQLHDAFRRTAANFTHLCPLDCLDDEVEPLRFGPNSIRKYSREEFSSLVDTTRLQRFYPTVKFEIERLSEFQWLTTRETTPFTDGVAQRALPFLYMTFSEDYGRIEPHKGRFVPAVQDALFALLLYPWEEYVQLYDFDWRGFLTPWVYSAHDDIFVRPRKLPAPDTLTWDIKIFTDAMGDEEEIEVPQSYPLVDNALPMASILNDENLAKFSIAQKSALFDSPVSHFFVRAFFAEGVDEFLAHITTIEAALGSKIDHDRKRRFKFGKNDDPSATSRISARLTALLGHPAAGDDFALLFDIRSEFLHGRKMNHISSADRVRARKLARQTVAALVRAAEDGRFSAARDDYLQNLLVDGYRPRSNS
jgi:hypothetical protein